MSRTAVPDRRLGRILAALLLLPVLGGCSSLGQALGFGKQSPDEFAVIRHERLAVPPKVDLRPPQPGARRPQERPPSELAKQALTGRPAATQAAKAQTQVAGLTQKTPGERALLRDTGAGKAPVNIREVVRVESASEGVQDRSLTNTLLFWSGEPERPATIDPVAEVERLRREGVIDAGANTVTGVAEDGLTIERRTGGFLGNIFN